MARKNLPEKQVSDSGQLYHFEKVVAPQLKKIESSSYALETSDLTKTVLITTIFLALQLVLYFVLKANLIRIPGISY